MSCKNVGIMFSAWVNEEFPAEDTRNLFWRMRFWGDLKRRLEAMRNLYDWNDSGEYILTKKMVGGFRDISTKLRQRTRVHKIKRFRPIKNGLCERLTILT